MQRVTVRTLALMVELLLAVVSYQYVCVSLARAARPDAVWVGGRSAPSTHTADVNSPSHS